MLKTCHEAARSVRTSAIVVDFPFKVGDPSMKSVDISVERDSTNPLCEYGLPRVFGIRHILSHPLPIEGCSNPRPICQAFFKSGFRWTSF
jgi:hypothetical protein